jgi:hypothetical protein
MNDWTQLVALKICLTRNMEVISFVLKRRRFARFLEVRTTDLATCPVIGR